MSELTDRILFTMRTWYYVGYGKSRKARMNRARKKEERQIKREQK